MRLASKVQEWIDNREWEDRVEVDEENQRSRINFSYGINEQSFDLWFETDENKEQLELYLYFPFKVKKDKLNDFVLLLNFIHSRSYIGGFCVLANRRIQYRHFVDVENAEPSIETINNMVGAGSDIITSWFEELVLVALTGKTTKEVIDDLSDISDEPEEVPNSI
ncbi:MAG: hypothetical protein RIQ94_1423 [Pseudomonadota bacterium]|jgi:hypothetical protein